MERGPVGLGECVLWCRINPPLSPPPPGETAVIVFFCCECLCFVQINPLLNPLGVHFIHQILVVGLTNERIVSGLVVRNFPTHPRVRCLVLLRSFCSTTRRTKRVCTRRAAVAQPKYDG